MSIEEFVKKHEDFLLRNKMDVSHSIQGKWYFSIYEEEYHYYDCFIEFKTVEELVDIIVGEIAFHLDCAIERNTNTPEFEKNDFADTVESYKKGDTDYEQLRHYLETIVNSELGNIELFRHLQELLKYK